ncbi:MAG TPA: hypothetical protein VN310_11060 [Candidatus Dormibacteraeota bacterium]|nr:hypothetical protein [Candidatus Dormibacteraeota bacterium]
MARFAAVTLAAITLACVAAAAHNQPASDPQAVAYAAKSVAAMTGSTTVSDVTLTGSVTWTGTDTGTATLKALGTGESRMDLALSSGTRTEIRDVQTGVQLGQWINPNNVSGQFASQNCQNDAVWFFPALGSLSLGPNVVLSYIGQESRNGGTVQHIQSYVYQPNPPAGISPTFQQLSTMDLYLDATTLLPMAITFNAHPDTDATTSLLVEVDFSNYQVISGVTVPTHIQRYQQGTLMVDVTVSSASFNTGIPLSVFAVN